MHCLLFLGTVRDSSPPRPTRLGLRVAHACRAYFPCDEDEPVVELVDPLDDWAGYFGRTFKQLLWWAEAAGAQRAHADPHKLITHFKRDPSERNAP